MSLITAVVNNLKTTHHNQVDLSIIIVDTNEGHVLSACIKSIYNETKTISFEVIVIDNGSTDGSGDLIRKEFPQVKVIRNQKNLGFAAANNRGFEHASGKFILLLNPDTEILDKAVEKTIQFMTKKPTIGIVGCALQYPNGNHQQSVRSFPSLTNVFFESTFLYLVFKKSKIVGHYYMTYFDYRSTIKVDWLSGAFFMIRREVVDAIGILDEKFYMYSEEVDFCWRSRAAGFETWYFHEAHVVHHWGGPNVTSQRLMLWVHKSQILFFQKHFTGIKKFILIAVKAVGLAIRVPVYGIAGALLFNRRQLEKSRLYTYTLLHLAKSPESLKD